MANGKNLLEVRYIIPHVVNRANGMTFEEFKTWFIETCYFANYRLKNALIDKFGTDDLEKMYRLMKNGMLSKS